MNDLQIYNEGNFNHQLTAKQENSSHSISVDSSRAVREVEAALIVAKSRPRDELDAYTSIMQSCSRPSFAEKAIYRFKRGNEVVEDVSIRLAEALARAYGNIDYGWREIERTGIKSIVEAYCWDLQTNTKQKRTFEVHHIRDTKQGQKAINSERDIYEHIANYASRRMRACILSIIPADLINDAKNKCKDILVAGITSSNKIDVSKKIVAAFEEIGVTHEMLKRYLGIEKVVGATEQQLVELRQIYVSIKEGHATIKEFFTFEETKEKSIPGESKTDELTRRLENISADS